MKNGNIVLTSTCRFCGQMITIETDPEGAMTDEQAVEAATMKCKCAEAEYYQMIANRKKTAIDKVNKLFGDQAPTEQREPESVLIILMAAVAAIAENKLAKITLKLQNDVTGAINLNSKDQIKVKRIEKEEQEL